MFILFNASKIFEESGTNDDSNLPVIIYCSVDLIATAFAVMEAIDDDDNINNRLCALSLLLSATYLILFFLFHIDFHHPMIIIGDNVVCFTNLYNYCDMY